MPVPRLSVALPQDLSAGGPALLARYARRAEELGFAGLWAADSGIGVPTARAPLVDPLHALSAAATVTERIGLGVAVIVAPRRNAPQLAKDAASVDVLSGGRLTLGLGVGNDPEEVAGLGFATTRRGVRLEETVDVLRALWADGEATHHGPSLSFRDVPMQPKPIQRPGPPIWIGAGRPVALRRAARIADGWIGAGSSPLAAFAEQAQRVAVALDAEGRDAATFPRARRVYLAVEDTAEAALARLTPALDGLYRWPGLTAHAGLAGPAAHVAEGVARLGDAGATEVLLNPVYAMEEQLERLAEVARLVGG